MVWQRGRPAIERLLDTGELEQVLASPMTGERLLQAAGAHISSGRQVLDSDPEGAFQLGYDAVRKACAALLAIQGLRATTRGGHIALQEAAREQFAGPNGLPVFARFGQLRRQRNAAQYPDPESPIITMTTEDADHCLHTAAEILDAARRLAESGRLRPWA